MTSTVKGHGTTLEFAEHSVRIMENFIRGEHILVLSILTVQELASAPAAVRQRLASVPEAHLEMLQLNAEAKDLAEAYVAAGVLTAKMRADAQHIAMATVGRVDIHGYNSVNLRRGYPMIEIRTPREVLSHE